MLKVPIYPYHNIYGDFLISTHLEIVLLSICLSLKDRNDCISLWFMQTCAQMYCYIE